MQEKEIKLTIGRSQYTVRVQKNRDYYLWALLCDGKPITTGMYRLAQREEMLLDIYGHLMAQSAAQARIAMLDAQI